MTARYSWGQLNSKFYCLDMSKLVVYNWHKLLRCWWLILTDMCGLSNSSVYVVSEHWLICLLMIIHYADMRAFGLRASWRIVNGIVGGDSIFLCWEYRTRFGVLIEVFDKKTELIYKPVHTLNILYPPTSTQTSTTLGKDAGCNRLSHSSEGPARWRSGIF